MHIKSHSTGIYIIIIPIKPLNQALSPVHEGGGHPERDHTHQESTGSSVVLICNRSFSPAPYEPLDFPLICHNFPLSLLFNLFEFAVIMEAHKVTWETGYIPSIPFFFDLVKADLYIWGVTSKTLGALRRHSLGLEK